MRRYAAKNSAQVSVGVDAFRNREPSASHPGSATAYKVFQAWKHAVSMNAVTDTHDGRQSTLASHRSFSVIEQGYEDVDAALERARAAGGVVTDATATGIVILAAFFETYLAGQSPVTKAIQGMESLVVSGELVAANDIPFSPSIDGIN